MSSYILRIVSAAIICGIAGSVLKGKTAAGQLVRLLCGLLMSVTVISPLTDISFNNLTDYFEQLSVDASAHTDKGESDAQESIAAIIKPRLETYILDKANSMGLQITVEVELDDSNHSFPCGVTVEGNVSPYAKEVLGAYIEDTLNIEKEQLRWT